MVGCFFTLVHTNFRCKVFFVFSELFAHKSVQLTENLDIINYISRQLARSTYKNLVSFFLSFARIRQHIIGSVSRLVSSLHDNECAWKNRRKKGMSLLPSSSSLVAFIYIFAPNVRNILFWSNKKRQIKRRDQRTRFT